MALHKKRIWRTDEGLFLDAGRSSSRSIAAEVGTVVTGKPSQTYFRMVLDDLDLPLHRVAAIGDDIEIDVRGAQALGIQGWLVKDRTLP